MIFLQSWKTKSGMESLDTWLGSFISSGFCMLYCMVQWVIFGYVLQTLLGGTCWVGTRLRSVRYSSSRMSQDPGSLETVCREVHPKSVVSHISSVTCVILHQECPCLCFHPCIIEHPPQLSRDPKCIQTSQRPKGGYGSLIPRLIPAVCLFFGLHWP